MVEKCKWNSIFRLDIPPLGILGINVGNKRSVYFGNFPVGQTKIASSFTVQPKFSGFFVNGKHS